MTIAKGEPAHPSRTAAPPGARRSHVPNDGTRGGRGGRARPQGDAPRGSRSQADPHRGRRPVRGAPPPGRRCLLLLPGRRDPAALRHPRRLSRAPPRPRPSRAGRRARGRRLRPGHRAGRRVHGHLRPGRHEPRHRDRDRAPRLGADGRHHRQRARRADRQGRLPGDRHQRHHPADDQAQLPGPRRRRPAARRGRGVPHRPDRAARARSTSTSPRTRSSRRRGRSIRPRKRSSPGCPASARTWTATPASSSRPPPRSPRPSGRSSWPATASSTPRRGTTCVAFAEKTQIPVAWTLLGIGAIDETHPLAYGYMGMHGWKHVNRAIQSADLLIAIGMRFDDRVTGNVRTYAPYARIIHADIDPAEIGKNVAVEVPIVGDAKRVLQALTGLVEAVDPATRADYFAQLAEWKADSVASSWHGSGAWRDGAAVGRLRHRADRRADRPRGDLRRRRRPEPDVARPLRRLPPPEHARQLGRPRHDGLLGPGGDGRGARRARSARPGRSPATVASR